MKELIQRVKDWYVLGPRDFYRSYIENFPSRLGLMGHSGEHGFLDMNPLPWGYAEIDYDYTDAFRRKFNRTLRKKDI